MASSVFTGTSANGPPDQHDSEGRQHNHDAERGFYHSRAFQNGQPVAPDIYDRAEDEWRKIPRSIPSHSGTRSNSKVAAESLTPSAVTSLNGTVWKPIGPSPDNQTYQFPPMSGMFFTSSANGRVSAIAINPNNPNLIYQGAAGGGVWRTIDGGSTWTPLLDQQVSLGIGEPGAIAIDPNSTDTIYVGTSQRFELAISKGILKTTDGGDTWIVLGSGFPTGNVGNAFSLFRGKNVDKIIVDPANSNVLYLAASNGLYRSSDAGQNWAQGTNGTGDSQSLALDLSSSAANRILFAGVNGSGIRRSNDGSGSWNQVLSATTPAVATALGTVVVPPGGSGPFIGKVIAALAPPLSPPNPAGVQVIYATVEMFANDSAGNPSGDTSAIFESTDQGATWTQRTATGLPGNPQGGFSLQMDIDPASPGDGKNDIIYFGAVGEAKSIDSGNTFTALGPGIHVDFHSNWAFVQQPSPPSIVFTGNDGGIWKSIDGGATWSGSGQPGAPATLNAGGLQTTLMYNIGVKQDATASVTEAALQDNGVPRTTGSATWNDTIGGDGFDFVFESANPVNAYHSGGFWTSPSCTRVFKSTDSGSTWPTAISDGNIPPSELDCAIFGGVQVHSVNVDPNNSGFVYVSGVTSLWQTRDGGTTFRSLNNFNNRVGEVDVAKANSNNVVASVRGQVWVSTNALASTVGPPSGVTFTNITRNLPGRDITRVEFDPNDATVIYATLSGFGAFNVARTTIGGTSWTDISPPVNVPVSAIALDGTPTPTTIYIGNDLGVMRSVDSGASWTVLDDVHLPNVPVTDLAINTQAGVLRASTFGRGAFDFAPANGPVISVNAQNGLQFGNVCFGSSATLTVQVFNVGTQNLNINSVQRIFGSSDFTVLPNPSTPLIISPNAEVDFTVQFKPSVTSGSESAQIRISSNDPTAPAFDLIATATIGVPIIDTVIAGAGNFGNVCVGSFADLALTINNSGTCDLSVTGISSSSGEFKTAAVMIFPLIVQAGGNLEVPIRLQPTSFGAKSANITITSNDPANPIKVVAVTGNTPPPVIKVTGSTTFGDVCAGTLAETTISVCNTGPCNLQVTGASFVPPCPDFTLINNPFPATVSPDSCLNLVIRFTPTSVGPKSCNLVITSNDPANPTITLVVTANTPTPSIDVPAGVNFAPTVIQSVGACQTLVPFPISNKGTCNLTITNIAISGPNASSFLFSGLPSFPIILQPGHTVGDGNLNAVFAPTLLARELTGTVTVTFESDPITHTTTSVTSALCGEGVRTGARVLVTAAGVPLASVDKIMLQRITGNRNKHILDSIDVAMDLPLVTVSPPTSCTTFQYHREYGTVSNPIQLLPGSYQVTVSATVNGKKQSLTVGFDVSTCTFNPNIVVQF
jgi:hypothetical protein